MFVNFMHEILILDHTSRGHFNERFNSDADTGKFEFTLKSWRVEIDEFRAPSEDVKPVERTTTAQHAVARSEFESRAIVDCKNNGRVRLENETPNSAFLIENLFKV